MFERDVPAYAASMTASANADACSLSAAAIGPVTCTRLNGDLLFFFARREISRMPLSTPAHSTFRRAVLTLGHFSEAR